VLDADRADLTLVPGPSAPIGDEMLVLRRTSFLGRGYVVAWRSGPFLAIVSALRRPTAATMQTALTLAARGLHGGRVLPRRRGHHRRWRLLSVRAARRAVQLPAGLRAILRPLRPREASAPPGRTLDG
jgi:hypothetical protein